MCDCVLLASSTGELCLSSVFGSGAEEKLPMLASREGSVLDAVVVNLSLAGFPLQCDTVICQFNRLEVFWGVQVYKTHTSFSRFTYIFLYFKCKKCNRMLQRLNSYTVALYNMNSLIAVCG